MDGGTDSRGIPNKGRGRRGGSAGRRGEKEGRDGRSVEEASVAAAGSEPPRASLKGARDPPRVRDQSPRSTRVRAQWVWGLLSLLLVGQKERTKDAGLKAS